MLFLEDAQLLAIENCNNAAQSICEGLHFFYHVDRLGNEGSRTFPCPTCRQVFKAPKLGFKRCRLSAFVKEKLQAVPTSTPVEKIETLSTVSKSCMIVLYINIDIL